MQIKLSSQATVNPKHVIGTLLDPTSLKTIVILVGMVKIPSDYDLETTMRLLNGENL